MAKSNFSIQPFLDKGYVLDEKTGTLTPPKINSPFIAQQRAKNEGLTKEDYADKFCQPIIKQRLDELTSLGIHSSPLIVFNVNPMGKPRMTQRDKWLKPPRKPVALYWSFKDVLKAESAKINFSMPESDYHIFCIIQMPNSWSDKKKNQMNNAPHQQKPDKDNIEKGILDALLDDDSKVWDGRVTKRWGRSGKIIIYPINKI